MGRGVKLEKTAYLDKEDNLVYESSRLINDSGEELNHFISVERLDDYRGNRDKLRKIVENEYVARIKASEALRNFKYTTDINKTFGYKTDGKLRVVYSVKLGEFYIREQLYEKREIVANSITNDIFYDSLIKREAPRLINCSRCKKLDSLYIRCSDKIVGSTIILPDKDEIEATLLCRHTDRRNKSKGKLSIVGCNKYIKLNRSLLENINIDTPIYIKPTKCDFSYINAEEINILIDRDMIMKYMDGRLYKDEGIDIRMHSSCVKSLNVNIDGTEYHMDNAKYMNIGISRDTYEIAVSIYRVETGNSIEEVISIKK